MSANSASLSNSNSSYSALFREYENVVIRSLITSFGLDFLVQDQHGGGVDTVNNVAQIGIDPKMTYKNPKHAAAYENRGEYNSTDYHSDWRYIFANREFSQQKKAGTLVDGYTGEKIPANGKYDLDHVISAKEIHDDRKRILAGLDGAELANSSENLVPTNPHTNRTKKADSMDEFLKKRGDEYSPESQARMKKKDEISRKSYDAKVNFAYYTSQDFAMDLGKASLKVGAAMGLRQALGLVFAEIWFAVRDAIDKCKGDGESLFKKIKEGVEQGFRNAKKKFKEIWNKFIEGSIAGILASLTANLANIFFTTAKHVVKIIRESWASFVQAFKILFVNPDNLPLGERIRAVAKVLTTATSVIAGAMVSELIASTPIGSIPMFGDIVKTFCGTLVAGIMSCSFLYLFDHNKYIQKVVEWLNSLPTVGNLVYALKQQGAALERVLDELLQIDWKYIRVRLQTIEEMVSEIEKARGDFELNVALKNACKKLNIKLPWGDGNFDGFMNDPNSKLRIGYDV